MVLLWNYLTLDKEILSEFLEHDSMEFVYFSRMQ